MVAIATLLPGASYAASTWSIPVTALNAVLSNDIAAVDSAERLLHSLLMCVYEKQVAGTVSQPTLGVEISAHTITNGTWETSANTFSEEPLASFLVTFRMSTSLLEAGNSIASV